MNQSSEVSPDSIFEQVLNFFANRAGDAQADEERDGLVPEKAGTMSLLRVACMGNAEKTIQGELFRYLRCDCNFNAVLECSYSDVTAGPDRSVDIMVFGYNFAPVVAIELKHYSPHQGTIAPLLGAMQADFEKSSKNIPVILVGIYTEVTGSITAPQSLPMAILEHYRFIRAYVLKSISSLTSSVMSTRFAAADAVVKAWLPKCCIPHIQNSGLTRGMLQSFTVNPPSGPSIEGRVNYLILMAQVGLADS